MLVNHLGYKYVCFLFQNIITNTKKFYRKIDIKSYRANTFLAKKKIGWKAKTPFKQIVRKMVYEELF